MNSVTFPNGHTYTDDGNPATGLDNNGHRTRFIPLCADVLEQALAAVNSATAAAASAASALHAPGTNATSASNMAIGIGSKSFVIQAGKAFCAGMYLLVSPVAGAWMLGSVSAYNSATGDITLEVEMKQGSGSYNSWTVSPTAPINDSTVVAGLGFTPGNLAAVNTWQQKQILNGGADFSGGSLIRGEFSAGTNSARTLFQTSAANSVSRMGILPSGSGDGAGFNAYASSDVDASSLGRFSASASEVSVSSTRNGAGAYLPLNFYTSDLLRLSLTAAGDLLFNKAGQRLQGDLSGALADRVYFQSSVNNATSTLGLLPNGSGSGAAWVAFNGSNPAQASTAQLEINSAEMRISSARTGTGAYLPMSFYTDGLQQMRLANAELQLPQTSHRIRGVMGSGEANDMAFQSLSGGSYLRVIPASGGTFAGFVAHNAANPVNSAVGSLMVNSSGVVLDSGTRGSGSLLPMYFSIAGTTRWTVDTSGRLRDVSSSMPFLSARRDASNQYGGTVVDFDGAFQQFGGANFNDTTNRFTVPVSGVYGFGASAQWYNQGAASSQAITLYNVTGSYVIDASITGTVASNSWGGANLGGAIYLTAGDQIEVRCGALTSDFYISKAYFSIYLLR